MNDEKKRTKKIYQPWSGRKIKFDAENYGITAIDTAIVPESEAKKK